MRHDTAEDDQSWTGVLHDDPMSIGGASGVDGATGQDRKLPQATDQFTGCTERAKGDVLAVAEEFGIVS